MRPITPHLWFDREAEEAATLYASLFPDSAVTNVTTIHDTPSGDTDIVSFTLATQPFMAISAGPIFTFNPSISFTVACETEQEVDALWHGLLDRGTELMPLGAYPFSARYGWLSDRFGLSWQIMLTDAPITQKITPMLLFVGDACGKAEEAMTFYASLFDDSSVGDITRYTDPAGPDAPGTVQYGTVTLAGRRFAAMDSAHRHDFTFNEAISFIVSCDTQEQIDHYWNALSAFPENEQCGWLKDRFGVSWQIVLSAMEKMFEGTDEATKARVTEAFLAMKKFDIAELERAHAGA